MYKIPYNKIELISALNSVPDEKFDEWEQNIEFQDKLKEIEEKFSWNREILNQIVAKHHGITVGELIASPNMEKLFEMFKADQIKAFIEDIKRILQTDDLVAHALIAEGLDLLN